jgi:glycosyltransferase involved in cell wall biosynthesis
MKIVHIGPDNLSITHRRGGAIERRILSLAKAQTLMGDCVIVYSIGHDAERRFYDGFEIRNMPCGFRGFVRHIIFQKRCLDDLSHEHVDIIHFHSQPEGAFLSRRINAKKFLTYDFYKFRHGKKNPLYFIYPSLLGRFDCLLPVSQYCLNESRRYWKLDSVRAEVVYNGVDLEQFFPDSDAGEKLKHALGITKRVILYVGRVCQQKGTDILLEAYKLLLTKRNDTILVIAGPAGQFGNIKPNLLTESISRVGGIYLGAIDEDQIASLFNIADVFVLPTRELEMFGMVAIEAQACGKPVVVSNHGGLKEVVAEGSGFRFSIGDFEELAEKISLLLDHPELTLSISLAARRNALRFDWIAIANNLRAIYLKKDIVGPGIKNQ